ncbi:MAG: hypothetical protein ACR2MA_03875 [Egibacteraceae bacterium]
MAREASRNLGAFRSAYAWLLRDLLSFSRGRVLGVVALNLSGVILQWLVVGGILIFVGELTGEGGAFQVPLLQGLELPAEASLGVVAAWSIVVLLIVVAATVCTYRAETVGFETALRYVDRSGGKILEGVLDTRTTSANGLAPPARQLQMVLARDQIMVLRALLVVQRTLRAILMVGVAACVLALINPILTAVVALVTMAFAVPYYLVNRRMVGAANVLEQRNLTARSSILRLVEHATSRDPNTDVRRIVPALYATDTAIANRWAVLRDIMLGGQRTAAVMSGLVGTCLVAVVVAFSIVIASDQASWVAALTYIVGLNLAAGAFAQLASQVTAANRFLPHIQQYIGFLDRFSSAHRASWPPQPDPDHRPLPQVRAPRPVLPWSATELTLTTEVRLLCVCPEPIDRLNAQSLLTRMVAGSQTDAGRLRDAAFFYGDPSALPPVPIRALMGDRGREALAQLALADEITGLRDGDATVLTPEVQAGLSPLLRYVLGILEGVGSELLILGWKSFARLSPAGRAVVLELIGPRPVIFTHVANPNSQPASITHTVILDDHGVAGMGDADWHKKVAPAVEATINQPTGVSSSVDDIADDA